ncbi:hypothetical protein KW482_17300 [Vibrio fluvialis]|nr:hypothetical protein [Vibrio fluvialis]
MSDLYDIVMQKHQKEMAFKEDYPISETWNHMDIYLHFSRWLDTGEYDVLDKAILICENHGIPIKGELLKEVAKAAIDRINRIDEVTKLYRKGKDPIPRLVKDEIEFKTLEKVFLLIGMCGLDAEEACFWVANWRCLKYRNVVSRKVASTIHKDCKNWLSKHKSQKIDSVSDKGFIERFGTFDRTAEWAPEDDSFMAFIQTKLNRMDQVMALGEYKLWDESIKKRFKNQILDGLPSLVESGDRCLIEDLRGEWGQIYRKISYGGTQFVQI